MPTVWAEGLKATRDLTKDMHMPSETRITQYTCSSEHGLSFWLAKFPTPLLAHLDESQSHALLAGYFQMSPSSHLINSMGKNTSVGTGQFIWWSCQECSHLLWNSKIHHHSQKCLLFENNMNQFNSIHNFTQLFHKIHIIPIRLQFSRCISYPFDTI